MEEHTDGKKTGLVPKKKVAFPLTERIQLSHNVFLFRFGLPSEEHTLGLPVGQHVFIYGKVLAYPAPSLVAPAGSRMAAVSAASPCGWSPSCICIVMPSVCLQRLLMYALLFASSPCTHSCKGTGPGPCSTLCGLVHQPPVAQQF